MPRLSPPRKRGAVSYADVTSANVVGYQLVKIPKGFSVFAPTFKAVGVDKLDIKSIEICDKDGNVLEDMVNEVGVQKMNKDGYYLDSVSYCPAFDGWNIDLEPLEDGAFTFAIGDAVCVNNGWEDSDAYFKVSGEVDLVNMNRITQGFSFWGNSTPVAIDIIDVQIVDEDGNVIEDMVNEVGIQKMDKDGYYLDSVSYCPAFDGWNIDLEPVERGFFTLEPGESVCVNNGWTDLTVVYMKLPCPVK